MVAKYVLRALRYYYLGHGERETAASFILSRLRSDPVFPVSWKKAVFRAVKIAREIEPPPIQLV
jgi:hypothetical protein